MEILIVGYGKMGKAVEALAKERGHRIAGKVEETQGLRAFDAAADVAVEFTQPDAAFDNLSLCLEKGIPVVSGTTGWLDRRTELEAVRAKNAGAFFYASNFSLGVNLFFRLNRHLARLMAPYGQYAPRIEETHHTEKKDAPSGTAIALAEGLLDGAPERLEGWKLVGESEIAPEGKLPVRAFREPDVPGTHRVLYGSELDEIEIRHTAHTRKGFALGAVVAAEWLLGKTGAFGMEDLLNDPNA